MKATLYTLGCKVNQNESGAMEQLLQNAGFEVVHHNDPADIYIVNSCTVTAGGDSKSRQWLRRQKHRNPNAITLLTGCFPQAFPKDALMPEADIIMGTSARIRLVGNINKFIATGEKIVDIEAYAKNAEFEELPIETMPERTRAFVKIEDGCNRRCAYCIIPTARGPVRSRSEKNILQELQNLAHSGYKEVVFTGINLPSYGQDTNTNLAEILEKSALVDGIKRIRLSSLDPDLITDKQIEVFASTEKFCRHFHLSLQSGSNSTLAAMHRPYTTEKYRTVVQKIRQNMPDASFTTDIIVGFPGETDEDFIQTLAFAKEIGFLKVHVFPFSPRPGTPAAEFENQIDASTKSVRTKLMQQETDKTRLEYIQKQCDTIHEVLLEKPTADHLFTGYTKSYIPIILHAPNHAQHDIVTVRLSSFDGERCKCELT